MFIWRGISLQNFNRCALLICDNLMGLLVGVLILLHAETPLLHKSFICRATGWRSCHYCNCCFPSNSADVSGKFFFLSENDNKYDYQVRDKRQSCLVVYNSVPVSLVLAKKSPKNYWASWTWGELVSGGNKHSPKNRAALLMFQ